MSVHLALMALALMAAGRMFSSCVFYFVFLSSVVHLISQRHLFHNVSHVFLHHGRGYAQGVFFRQEMSIFHGFLVCSMSAILDAPLTVLLSFHELFVGNF